MARLAFVLLVSLLALESQAAEYSHDLAKRMVVYAGASYCAGKKALDDWSCKACMEVPGFQHITQLYGQVTDASAILGYDPALQARIVAFRGTNLNTKTWLDDVLVVPTPCYAEIGCNGCNCHPGFKLTYESIAEAVYKAVKQLPSGKLIITGHSLGAAVATHCAMDLNSRGLKVDHIYTFGQPRVGNDAFANHYDRLGLNPWRVTHHEDPIPHLPWRGLGGYKHNLREAYYEDANADAPAKLCDAGFAEDPSCADQFNDELTLPHLLDHWSYLGFSFAADVNRCTPSSEHWNSTVIV